MGGGQVKTPEQRPLQPGPDNRYAKAAGIPKKSQKKRKRHNHGVPYRLTSSVGEPFRIVVSDCVQWALNALCDAGETGITSVENPAGHLAAYVHDLRSIGIKIETIIEPIEDGFPGHHARHILRSGVSLGCKRGAL